MCRIVRFHNHNSFLFLNLGDLYVRMDVSTWFYRFYQKSEFRFCGRISRIGNGLWGVKFYQFYQFFASMRTALTYLFTCIFTAECTGGNETHPDVMTNADGEDWCMYYRYCSTVTLQSRNQSEYNCTWKKTEYIYSSTLYWSTPVSLVDVHSIKCRLGRISHIFLCYPYF